MEDEDDGIGVLDVVQEILETDRTFFQMTRFLDGHTRNHVVAAHLRNTSLAYGILRAYMTEPRRTTMVMNIPITMDLSGSFFDPVPVVPSPEQIDAALDRHVGVPVGTLCAVCQEDVACASQIRACGHLFHSHCIGQWLQMNPRCPVCRHDIRLLRDTPSSSSE